MARLTGKTVKEVQADRIEIARAFAKQHQCVLVLKGHRTLVATPDGTVWVNVTGNPGMATGGAGDVLTGMTAGLLAQAHAMNSPDANVKAVIAAVYLHGLAGDVARDRMGEASLIATDIIAGLPEAFRRAQQQLQIADLPSTDEPFWLSSRADVSPRGICRSFVFPPGASPSAKSC